MTFAKRNPRIFLIGVLGLLAPAAAVRGQAIVVTAKSASELADDLEYLIKSVAPDDDPMAQATLDALKNFKSGALVKGLDRGRGFGLAVSLPRNFPEGGSPSVVAAVPVTDLGQLLDSLKGLGIAVDDQPGVDGFSHKVSVGDGNVNLFVLQSKGYALFSMIPDGADKLKALDPSSWWAKGRPETALGVKVQLAEIPEAFKDQFLNQLEAQAGQQEERQPGESDAQFKARVAGQNLAFEAFRSLVRDGDALALNLDLDRKIGEAALELAVTARPGTAMAKTLRALDGRRSRFEGLGQDAAMAFWANLPMAKELRKVMADGFDQGMKQGLKSVDSAEQRKLLTRFGELMKANLDAPEIDLGLAIRPSSPAGKGDAHFLLLGGMRLQDGRAFDRLVREAVAEFKPEKGFKVTFDVAKAADGTAIHQMTGPYDKDDADVVKHFGKASLSFAFRENDVLVAFGEDSLTPLRKALEGPPAPAAPGSAGPVALVVHMASLGEFAEENQEAIRRATAEVFGGQAVKRDRFSLGLKGGGDGIRLRMALDLPAFKLAVKMGKDMPK